MLNTNRFYIKPLAFCIMNSMAFSPVMAYAGNNDYVDNDIGNSVLENLSRETPQAKDFYENSNIQIDASSGMNISVNGNSASIDQNSDIFKDDNADQDLLNKAKKMGEGDNLQSLIDYGQQLKSEFANEKNDSDVAGIYRDTKKIIQDGSINVANDPVVVDALKVFDKDDPNSIYNYFSDACQSTSSTSSTSQSSKFVGTEEVCLKYKDAEANCNIKHSYEINVIQPTSEEQAITLESCSCRKGDTTCTDETIKHCTAFWVGTGTSSNNLLAPGSENTSLSCVVYRQKASLVIHKPQALTKLYLDGASIDDNAAVYLYKYGETPDYSKPIWKSHDIIPARNIEYNKDLNGSVHFCNPYTEPKCAIPKYSDNRTFLPAYDVITGKKLDDPQKGKYYSGETNGKYKAPLVDLTSFFVAASPDDVYVIELLLSVSGRGQGSLHFRAEYDPSKAIDETWTSENKCLDKFKAFSEQSRLTTGAVSCTAYGDQVKVGDSICGITNGHIVCPEAFGTPEVPYLLSFDSTTNQYKKENVYPDHLTCKNFNFVYSTLSPSEMEVNRSCDEVLQTAADNGKSCYMTKTECLQSTSEAEEQQGGSGNIDDCYLKQITYTCGKEEKTEETTETTKTSCGDGNMVMNCENGSCIGLEPTEDNTSDFARTSAILQAVDFMAQDFKCVTVDGNECSENEQREYYIEIFGGKRKHCHIFDTGLTYQNCCKNMSGVSVSNYMHDILVMSRLLSSKQTLGRYVDKIDPTGLSTSLTDSQLSAADKLNTKVNSWLDSITGVEGGANLAQNTVMLIYVNMYKEQLLNAISNLLRTVGDTITGSIYEAAAASGVKGAEHAATDEATAQAGQAATDEALGSLAGAASIVGTVYTIYSVINMSLKLIFKCRNIDFETASDKALKKCYQIETKCKVKVFNPLGKSKTCADREYYFCCYNSPLARIVMQQIKKTNQLGFSEDNKSCGGIKLDHLDKLDWSKLDLSEWTSLILEAQNGSLNDEQLKITEALSDINLSPSGSAAAIEENSTSDEIAQLVMYFADREEDPALMKEFRALPQATREAIIAREEATQKAYEDSINHSELSEAEEKQYEDLVNTNIRDDNANLDEEEHHADMSNSTVNQELMAAQLNYSLIAIGKLSDVEIAEAIIDNRISVPNSIYAALKEGYNSEKKSLSDVAKKIVKQIRSDNVNVKISAVPLTVENISGEKSILNINRSSSTDPNSCSDNDQTCTRKSAIVRLDNTIEILKKEYGDNYQFSLEVEESTPMNLK